MLTKKSAAPDAGNIRSGHEKSSTDSIPAPAPAVNPSGKTEQVRQKITEGKRLGREMLAAMLAGVPVQIEPLSTGPVVYERISALVYRLHQDPRRPEKEDVQMSVELVDASGHSITLAAPGKVTVLWGDQEPPKVPEDVADLIHEERPVDIGALKAALLSFHTVIWGGVEYRSMRAVYFRPDGWGNICVDAELANPDSAGLTLAPADQIEITGHLLNRR